ncbi:hypothetical protein D5278_12880 [bacterium 1XD21-13]|nr:hypothetical protein [bacterium 1XD21-13]
MRKNMIKATAFLLLAALLLARLNGIFRLKRADGIRPMEIFYEQEKNSIDVIFYGSSHVYSDINPAVLWREKGIASFDLAGTLQPMWNTYYYMKESLKYQRPKVMVVELVRAIEEREYIEEARVMTNTFGMRLSREKYEAIQVSTPDNKLAYLLGYPAYHSRYTELSREDFGSYKDTAEGEAYKGFYPLFDTKEFEELTDISGITDSRELAPKTEEYLQKIIELAREEEIPLVFMVSPYQIDITEEQRFFNRCGEIAKENGVPFLDFNRMYEELGLDPGEDMAEASHLNHRGSTKLSAWLANWLQEKYELPDRRGEIAYESWGQNALRWEQLCANQDLREETGWYDFLEKLTGNPNYTYVISLNGEYDSREQPVLEVLPDMGIPLEIVEQGGIWIHASQEEKSFPGQMDMQCHMEFEGSDLLVRRNQSGVQMIFDGKNYFKVENGLNVLVYDELNQELVIAAGFDAGQGYACVW